MEEVERNCASVQRALQGRRCSWILTGGAGFGRLPSYMSAVYPWSLVSRYLGIEAGSELLRFGNAAVRASGGWERLLGGSVVC